MTTAKTIREPGRDLPVAGEYDVIVVGGGPGGLPAAIAASRQGAHTLLIERYGFLGGLPTANFMTVLLGHVTPGESTAAVEGITREMVERIHALGGSDTWREAVSHHRLVFDPEIFKLAADRMVRESGAELLLHTFATDALVADGAIKALIVESKSGREAVLGKVIVDATGDADIIHRAGAPTHQGRDFDSLNECFGAFVWIGGAPADLSDEEKAAVNAQVEAAARAGRLHLAGAAITRHATNRTEYYSPSLVRRAGDPTNVRDLTRVEIEAREDMQALIAFLREEVPGFENAYVLATPPQMGPRESRQIAGAVTLTAEDVRAGRKFPDSVARGAAAMDIMCPFGNPYPVVLCTTDCVKQADCPYWRAEHDKGMFALSERFPPAGDWFAIPYRALVPTGIDNALAAGRCISADHQAMASIRIMATCMATGEAAGIAAAMAANDGIAVRDVDVKVLRSALEKAGALV
jgi:hypothetical protein